MGKFKCWEYEGQWYFHLKTEKDEIIAQSEGHETKESCINVIELVKRTAPYAGLEIEGEE